MTTETRYAVRYYCPKASRKGRGVQVAAFATRAEAEAFAEGRSLYSKPAKVEPVAASSQPAGPTCPTCRGATTALLVECCRCDQRRRAKKSAVHA